jgi:hypothetical protein
MPPELRENLAQQCRVNCTADPNSRATYLDLDGACW